MTVQPAPATKVHNFYTDSSPLGAWGVQRIIARFQASGWQVEDIQDDPFGWGMDIDLMVVSPLGHCFTLEVKADRYPNTIYMEEYARLFTAPDAAGRLGEPGCVFYTRADFVVYYLVTRGFALVMPTKALQTWLRSSRFKDFPAKNPWTSDSKLGSARSQGRPVPLEVVQREVAGTYILTGLPVYGATNRV